MFSVDLEIWMGDIGEMMRDERSKPQDTRETFKSSEEMWLHR